MKLSLQHWAWDGGIPERGWADTVAADLPAIWRAHLPEAVATLKHFASILSAEEQTRLASFRQANDQTRYLTDGPTVRDVLDQLGEPTAPSRIAPARGPPLWEAAGAEHEPTADQPLPPIPAYEFDQRLTW